MSKIDFFIVPMAHLSLNKYIQTLLIQPVVSISLG